MKRLTAGGAIGMLLTMIIIAILFIVMMPSLKDADSAGFYGSSLNKKSVEEQVNTQVEQIQKMRQQTIKYNQNLDQY